MPSNNLTDLQGQIERITFTSEETGYTVAKIKVYGRRELVTIIGNIVNPTPGEIVKMKGEWGNHPKYGEQFKIVFKTSVNLMGTRFFPLLFTTHYLSSESITHGT